MRRQNHRDDVRIEGKVKEDIKPMKIIAYIHNDFQTKFGIPRQSGLIDELKSTILFEKEYRNIDAVRGLEEFSHIWIIWKFSESVRDIWSPTVRPPRLGGNKRIGVFATRSPFRPNAIGLSSVKLDRIEYNSRFGPILHISGADLMNQTPIFDIKPYLPYVDSHPDAIGGFTERIEEHLLDVIFPKPLFDLIPKDRQKALKEVLSYDPRPSYQDDPTRVYGFLFAGFQIKFVVRGSKLVVSDVTPV